MKNVSFKFICCKPGIISKRLPHDCKLLRIFIGLCTCLLIGIAYESFFRFIPNIHSTSSTLCSKVSDSEIRNSTRTDGKRIHISNSLSFPYVSKSAIKNTVGFQRLQQELQNFNFLAASCKSFTNSRRCRGFPLLRKVCNGNSLVIEFGKIKGVSVCNSDLDRYGTSSNCFANPLLPQSSNVALYISSLLNILETLYFARNSFVEDLTGSNLMLKPDGEVVLIDFEHIIFKSHIACLHHSECPAAKTWLYQHNLSHSMFSGLKEINGYCEVGRWCSLPSTSTQMCGVFRWLLKKAIRTLFQNVASCITVLEDWICSPYPMNRISVPGILSIIRDLMNPLSHFDWSKVLSVPNVGYQPYRNGRRLLGILNVFKKYPQIFNKNNHLCAVDFGSNQGYFSTVLSKLFPKSFIFSVDSNEFYQGVFPASVHARISDVSQHSNYICRASWTEAHITHMYSVLNPHKMALTYQLVLSIFHWFKFRSFEVAKSYLIRLIQSAIFTFIELPSPSSTISGEMKLWLPDSILSIHQLIHNICQIEVNCKVISSETSVITDDGHSSEREMVVVLNPSVMNYKCPDHSQVHDVFQCSSKPIQNSS
jgi:hypothetical protein